MKSMTLFSILILAPLLIGCGGATNTPTTENSSTNITPKPSATSQKEADSIGLTLRYRFQEGQRMDYLSKLQMVNDITSLGQKTETNIDIYLHVTVDAVEPDGTATVTWINDRLVYKVQGPGGTIRYDSADDEEPDNPQWQLVKPQIMPIQYAQGTFRVSPEGIVSDFKPTKELAARFETDPTLAATLSPSRNKAMAEQLFITLPGKPIKPNETWSTTSKFSIGSFKVDFETTRTYQGQEKRDGQDIARVAGTLKIATEFGPDAPFKKLQYKDGASSSEFFDLKRGWLIEKTGTNVMEIETETMGLLIVAETTQKSSLRLQPGSPE